MAILTGPTLDKGMNKLNLPLDQWASVAKGAAVAGAGALLTYLLQNVGDLDTGAYTPLVVAVLSVLANYVRKVSAPDA